MTMTVDQTLAAWANTSTGDATCLATTSNLTSMSDAIATYITSNEIKTGTLCPANKEKAPLNAKHILTTKLRRLYSADCEDGYVGNASEVMWDIKDVQVIYSNDVPVVVVVEFFGGGKEKAILHPEDPFSIEMGISICITKKLLAAYTQHEGALYNKLIDRGIKVYKNSQKAALKKEAEAQEKKKQEERARVKVQRKRDKKREEQIAIQKEAYLRALREMKQ